MLGAADDHIAKLEQLREIGVDQFAGYLQHDNKEETLHPGDDHARAASVCDGQDVIC